MKRMMLLGGLLGFGLAMASGLWASEVSWPGLLLRASVGCLVGGWLVCWIARVTLQCVQQANAEREAARPTKTPLSPKTLVR
jgi:hypothetical protein